MRILAIETSSGRGTVALLDDEDVVYEIALPTEKRTAQTLAPAIEGGLAWLGWSPRQLDLLVTTRGPGSFTGLRVGVMTAKTMAYATGARVIGLNTLEVIAAQSRQGCAVLDVIMDAQRQQLYWARFQRDGSGHIRTIEPTQIVDCQTWLDSLRSGIVVTGPGLSTLAPTLADRVTVLDQQFWQPQAAILGRLGWQRDLSGQRDDLFELEPRYYRKSAAEEKRQL